jgi:hypothetical protein
MEETVVAWLWVATVAGGATCLASMLLVHRPDPPPSGEAVTVQTGRTSMFQQ